MSPKLGQQLEVAFEQLRALLSEARPHLQQARERTPDAWDRSAFAATLQAFYNAVENALVRIAVATGEPVKVSDGWHKDLLAAMSHPTAARAAVISDDLAARLKEYLQFRHFFRHGYPFDLLWERMAPLLEGLESTYHDFHTQITRFLSSHEPCG